MGSGKDKKKSRAMCPAEELFLEAGDQVFKRPLRFGLCDGQHWDGAGGKELTGGAGLPVPRQEANGVLLGF